LHVLHCLHSGVLFLRRHRNLDGGDSAAVSLAKLVSAVAGVLPARTVITKE
jgi:hypothetical protein